MAVKVHRHVRHARDSFDTGREGPEKLMTKTRTIILTRKSQQGSNLPFLSKLKL